MSISNAAPAGARALTAALPTPVLRSLVLSVLDGKTLACALRASKQLNAVINGTPQLTKAVATAKEAEYWQNWMPSIH